MPNQPVNATPYEINPFTKGGVYGASTTGETLCKLVLRRPVEITPFHRTYRSNEVLTSLEKLKVTPEGKTLCCSSEQRLDGIQKPVCDRLQILSSSLDGRNYIGLGEEIAHKLLWREVNLVDEFVGTGRHKSIFRYASEES